MQASATSHHPLFANRRLLQRPVLLLVAVSALPPAVVRPILPGQRPRDALAAEPVSL